MANRSEAILETIVNSFTNADELMDFAATWGIQDFSAVRWRLLQLRNNDETFVNDQLDDLLPMLGGATEQSVHVRNEVEESIKALQFDEEMEALGQACVDDGERNPQIGGGDEPQPGPSHQPDTPQGLQYIMRKKSERTYAKNAAVDRTYQIKINE